MKLNVDGSIEASTPEEIALLLASRGVATPAPPVVAPEPTLTEGQLAEIIESAERRGREEAAAEANLALALIDTKAGEAPKPNGKVMRELREYVPELEYRHGRGVFRRADNNQLFIPATNEELVVYRALKDLPREKCMTSRYFAEEICGLTNETQIKTAMGYMSNLAKEERGVERVPGRKAYRLSAAGRQAQWLHAARPQTKLQEWRRDGMKSDPAPVGV